MTGNPELTNSLFPQTWTQSNKHWWLLILMSRFPLVCHLPLCFKPELRGNSNKPETGGLLRFWCWCFSPLTWPKLLCCLISKSYQDSFYVYYWSQIFKIYSVSADIGVFFCLTDMEPLFLFPSRTTEGFKEILPFSVPAATFFKNSFCINRNQIQASETVAWCENQHVLFTFYQKKKKQTLCVP